MLFLFGLLDVLRDASAEKTRVAIEEAERCTMQAATSYALSSMEPAAEIASAAIDKCSASWAAAGAATAGAADAPQDHDAAMQTRVLVDRSRSKIVVRVFDARAARR